MLKNKTKEDHLHNKSNEIVRLFGELEARILALNAVIEKVTNPYIGYKLKVDNKQPRLFVEVHVQNKKIDIHLRKLDYYNPSGLTIKLAPDSHKWTLNKLVDVDVNSNLDFVMKLIGQSYNDVK